ncbi:MAG: hypothetical protein SFX73_24785 [Kofleriaceae bacterium]|nr:hypothetical protein [Kofleriaceae bacterium]
MIGRAALLVTHVCLPDDATAGPPCEQEIQRVCPSGQYEACTAQHAPSHLCVIDRVR